MDVQNGHGSLLNRARSGDRQPQRLLPNFTTLLVFLRLLPPSRSEVVETAPTTPTASAADSAAAAILRL